MAISISPLHFLQKACNIKSVVILSCYILFDHNIIISSIICLRCLLYVVQGIAMNMNYIFVPNVFLARLSILIKKGGLLQLKFGGVGVGVNIYLWAR